MQINYSKRAIEHIKALDKGTRNRVITGIEKLPEGDVKKLKGFKTSYRLRIGDYRILYEWDNDGIFITDVLPRGDAYK